jgi:glycogen debranching enzyme
LDPKKTPLLFHDITLEAGAKKSLRFVIAGSSTSEAEARATYLELLQNAGPLLVEKRDRYAALAEKSKLSIPDTALQQAFEWLKYNSDWMIQEVPGIGRGIRAGIPDYPWWFGVDSEYALRGYMAVGQTDIVYETIRLLDSVSMAVNGNGRILHEMSTNGAVFNPGNINETPQFASLIWHVYRWGGDEAFLRRYFPTVQKGLQWLMETKDANQNGFPDGFGMMEIHGLDSEMIDVAAYTQAAFHHAAQMAEVLGEEHWARQYAAKAEDLKKKINAEFWSEAFGSYADFMGTDEQALHLIEDAIVRADTLNKPWAVAELEQTRASILSNPKPGLRPFVLHHNWVVNTPMEMGIADTAKALRAMETARNFINPFGMFVTGIDRDASSGEDEGSFAGSKVFSYTGAVMTLPTGVQAVAENNYGRPDRALDYLQRMTRSFSYALPGSMYEVSPDYGMMAQAWNIFSFAVPIVEQFFGISPMAAEKKIRIAPLMPSAWNRASLENVQVGPNELSVFFSRTTEGRVHIRAEQTLPGWVLVAPVPFADSDSIELVSGEMETDGHGRIQVVSNGAKLEFTYSPGAE